MTVNAARIGKGKAEAEARAIGIDEALISEIVDAFYGRIQVHPSLGPIFSNVIKDNWSEHLRTMKTFWGSIVLYSAAYHGKPMPKHRQLEGVDAVHFEMWLELFEQTLGDIVPSEKVVHHFMLRAKRIAQSLQAGMYLQ